MAFAFQKAVAEIAQNNADPPRLMDEKEAAAALTVSVATIQRLRKSGAISFQQIGGQIRYTKDDIRDYLTSTKVKAWPKPALKSGDIGSPKGLIPPITTQPGSTASIDKHAAHLLALQTFSKPK